MRTPSWKVFENRWLKKINTYKGCRLTVVMKFNWLYESFWLLMDKVKIFWIMWRRWPQAKCFGNLQVIWKVNCGDFRLQCRFVNLMTFFSILKRLFSGSGMMRYHIKTLTHLIIYQHAYNTKHFMVNHNRHSKVVSHLQQPKAIRNQNRLIQTPIICMYIRASKIFLILVFCVSLDGKGTNWGIN